MLRLRDYQEQAVAGVRRLLAAGVNRPAGVMATGLGKTNCFVHLLADHLASHPRERGLVLVRRDELAEQARDRIHQHAPHLRPGIVMGSRRDHDRPVVVASVQTLSRSRTRDGVTSWPRRDQIHSVGMTIYDEAHHAAAPTDRAVLEHFGAWNGVPTIGFTATMTREDNRGLGEIWQEIVQRPDGGVWSVEWGIRNGWLCDVRGFRVKVPALDLSGVHIRAGEYDANETAAAMLDADTGAAIVKAIHDLAPDRRGVVFAPNVAAAVDFAADMNAAGIRTGVILGSTPRHERTEIYRRFRTGELQWLTNVVVNTEGWDAPWCDAIILARLVRSKGLYQQILGRGLRTFAGKQDCLVLDMCGSAELHGLASLTDLSEDRKVVPRDGQSLLEALDEEDLEFDDWSEQGAFGSFLNPPPAPVHHVVGTEIDLFGNSHSVWLQTRGGTWFVPAADQFFYLWPQIDGRFSIFQSAKNFQHTHLIQSDVDLDIGMALAEQHAEMYAPEVVGKNAPWRQQGPARAGQKRELEAWGIPIKRGMTAAQAYDSINIAMASNRLDVKR